MTSITYYSYRKWILIYKLAPKPVTKISQHVTKYHHVKFANLQKEIRNSVGLHEKLLQVVISVV